MENKRNHESGFGNGFLFGLIVGAAIALLFATKKGRKILRELTSEGKDTVSGLKEYLRTVEESVEDSDESFADDGLEQAEEDYDKTPLLTGGAPEQHTSRVHVEEEDTHQETSPKPLKKVTTGSRRFFKGVTKRN